MAEQERCVPLLDDDGQVVASVRMSGEMDEPFRRAMLDVVTAATRLHAEQDAADPGRAARQEAAVRRIRERAYRGLEWRYLPAGRVRHALRRSDDAGAACGRYVLPASEWRGTGSQVEYERVAQLRQCRDCVKALGGDAR